MTERATIFEGVQVGVESTAGTAVAARKRLSALSIAPSIENESDAFKPQGSKAVTLVTPNKEWSAANLSGKPTYTEIVYPLSCCVDVATITTPGGGTDSRNWQFKSSTNGPDAPKTLTVESGSSVRAMKFAHGIISEFGLSINRGGLSLTGSMFGHRITDNITMSASRTVTDGVTLNADATFESENANFTAADVGALVEGTNIPAGTRILSYTDENTVELTANATGAGTGLTVVIGRIETIDLIPILPTQCSVYLDTTYGGIGGTKLTRVLALDLSITNRFAPLWVVDAAQTSFVTYVEVEPQVTANITLAADSQGMGLLTNMRAGDVSYLRFEAEGATIEGSIPYTFLWDMPVSVVDTGGMRDQDGVFATEWNLVAIEDDDLEGSYDINVINELTAL